MAHLPPGTFHPTTKDLVPTKRPADLRSEDEIAAYILSPRPVTHEKNVWAFWDRGWAAMSPWTQRNIIDWVRRLGSAWDVRVLDKVPGSQWNVQHFVDRTKLPDTFWNMDGPHAGQHASDLVRCLLLYQHGGFWIDVGAVLTRHLDDLWECLTDPDDPTSVVAASSSIGDQFMPDLPVSNLLLASRKGDRFMELWHTVFVEMWRGRTSAQDIRLHPLIAHLTPIARPEVLQVEVTSEQMDDYLSQMSAAGRLLALVDPANNWDDPAFYEKCVALVPVEAIYMHNLLTAFSGEREFALLASPHVEPVPDGLEAKEAETYVETVLAKSVWVKLSQGVMPHPIQLATIWDRKENLGMDVKPGTWAEYFRWASVHLDQTAPLTFLTKEQKFERQSKDIWTAGIMDVVDSSTPVRENRAAHVL